MSAVRIAVPVRLARHTWLALFGSALLFCVWLALTAAPCRAQDNAPFGEDDPFAEGFDQFEDEFSAEFGEEFGPGNRSTEFEDLPPAVQAVIIIVAVLFFLVMVGIGIFILYLLYKLLDALPAQYRLMEPAMVWLLLIPCFNLVWNFFVYARIARSYQNYFFDHGRTDVGDCGATLGIWYSVCAVLVSIPCLNYITGIFCGPAMLVLIIIYLLRLHELKRQIPLGKPATATGGQSPFSM